LLERSGSLADNRFRVRRPTSHERLTALPLDGWVVNDLDPNLRLRG